MKTFESVKRNIGKAIESFEDTCFCTSTHIKSEADFERLLTNHIEKSICKTNYVIHNQISYYGSNNALKYRVDAVVMSNQKMESSDENNKGFYYEGESIPIELKFYKKGDCVNSIKYDIDKSIEYLRSNPNAFLFVVALLENDNRKSEKINRIVDEYSNKNFSVIILHLKTCRRQMPM